MQVQWETSLKELRILYVRSKVLDAAVEYMATKRKKLQRKEILMKNYSKRKCCRFSFPIYDLFCVSIHFQPSFENVKMLIPTALAKHPGCTHSFVKFSALLPANEKLKKTPKIIGSTFPFLDIHLLSDFFHKNRFHPASPTEGLTSIQQLTLEKAVERCIYSICKMV